MLVVVGLVVLATFGSISVCVNIIFGDNRPARDIWEGFHFTV